MPSPYTAQLDDWLLNIFDISDDIKPNIVKYEFIGRDGAILDNFGNSARTTRFRTYWYGNINSIDPHKQQPSYQSHRDFLKHISDGTIKRHTLIHPKYGTISGSVSNITIFHDDTKQYAHIDIDFVEDGLTQTNITINNFSINKLVDGEQLYLINGQLVKTASTMEASGLSELLSKTVDTSKAIEAQLRNISAKSRKWVQEADRVVSTIDRFLNSITSPVTSLTYAVNYAADIPSHVVQSVHRACDRIVALENATTNAPAASVQNMATQVRLLLNSVTTGQQNALNSKNTYNDLWTTVILSIGAGALAQAAADNLAQDQINRDNQKLLENTQTFYDNGNRTDTMTNVIITMSVTDLENMVYAQRNLAQEAINADRDQKNLMAQCSYIIRYLDIIKLQKTSIVNMTVNNMPLHLLCLQLGLSYQAAERILKINPQIKNPTFAEGNLKVYTI